MIKGFENHRFLSNFWPVPFMFDGIHWPNVECAYQWYKTEDHSTLEEYRTAAPGKAKRMGQRGEFKKNWERQKFEVMLSLVRGKFYQNPDLAKLLLETGDEYILEFNTWGDTYWGVVQGDDAITVIGKNRLGEILMLVRDELSGKGIAGMLNM